jgi:hypothetical protein
VAPQGLSLANGYVYDRLRDQSPNRPLIGTEKVPAFFGNEKLMTGVFLDLHSSRISFCNQLDLLLDLGDFNYAFLNLTMGVVSF